MSIQSTIKPKQIWVLSSRSFKSADKSLKWNSFLPNSPIPNFVDCDLLIVDLPTLVELPIIDILPKINGIKTKKAYKNLFFEREHIAEMIRLGGTLICITMPYREYYTLDYSRIDNYSWLPLYPDIEGLTQGIEKELQENVYFKEYYTKCVKKYHFEIKGFSGIIKSDTTYVNNSKAITKAGRVLGVSIGYGKGLIHFLPPPTNVGTKYAIDFLIKIIRETENELFNIPPPPNWMQNYISEIERKTIENREKLYHKILEEDDKIKKFQEINQIIWVCGDLNNGKTLENSVKVLFEKEFKLDVVKTPPGSHVDLKVYCRVSKRKFALEITGITNKVVNSTKKCAQITHYNWKKEKDEKIVFIANTYCDKEIKDRPNENFSIEVEETLKPLHVCLITTIQLFNLWKEMNEGKITKEKIIEKLYKTDGIFKN